MYVRRCIILFHKHWQFTKTLSSQIFEGNLTQMLIYELIISRFGLPHVLCSTNCIYLSFSDFIYILLYSFHWHVLLFEPLDFKIYRFIFLGICIILFELLKVSDTALLAVLFDVVNFILLDPKFVCNRVFFKNLIIPFVEAS